MINPSDRIHQDAVARAQGIQPKAVAMMATAYLAIVSDRLAQAQKAMESQPDEDTKFVRPWKRVLPLVRTAILEAKVAPRRMTNFPQFEFLEDHSKDSANGLIESIHQLIHGTEPSRLTHAETISLFRHAREWCYHHSRALAIRLAHTDSSTWAQIDN